jgi:HSP20 family molecular chaperone IbpA
VFDLEKYAPEDVKVTVDGDELSVEAVREVKLNGKTNVQQYSETVYLPKYVHPDRLISRFNNGRLVIEHPLPPSYNEALILLREMREQCHS